MYELYCSAVMVIREMAHASVTCCIMGQLVNSAKIRISLAQSAIKVGKIQAQYKTSYCISHKDLLTTALLCSSTHFTIVTPFHIGIIPSFLL